MQIIIRTMNRISRKVRIVLSLLPYVLLLTVFYLYVMAPPMPQSLTYMAASPDSHERHGSEGQSVSKSERSPYVPTPTMKPECVNTDVYDVYTNLSYNKHNAKGHHYHSVKLNTSQKHADFVYRMTKTNLFMNHEVFGYVIDNRRICEERRPRVVVAMQVSVRERCVRDAIRDTWGSKRIQKQEQVVVLFFLAMSTNTTLISEIHRESETHGDIVLETYTDSLHNLSLKYAGMTKWVVRYCRSAEYMIHSDGDTYMDLHRINLWIHTEVRPRKLKNSQVLYSTLEAKTHTTPYEAYCRMGYRGIIRNKKSKYYVGYDQIAGTQTKFPPYCSGCWYMTDIPTATALYAATINSGYVWIPDPFMAGYMMTKINAKFNDLTNDQRFAYNSGRVVFDMPGVLVACQLYPQHLYVLHHIIQGNDNSTQYTLSFNRN